MRIRPEAWRKFAGAALVYCICKPHYGSYLQLVARCALCLCLNVWRWESCRMGPCLERIHSMVSVPVPADLRFRPIPSHQPQLKWQVV